MNSTFHQILVKLNTGKATDRDGTVTQLVQEDGLNVLEQLSFIFEGVKEYTSHLSA